MAERAEISYVESPGVGARCAAKRRSAMEKAWANEVLSFWFDELTPEDWYSGKPAVDEAIVDRFSELYETLKAGAPSFTDGREALAAVIVYDQFPRNMFRKRADAFGTDNLAIGIARDAVLKGFDRDMTASEKQFLYMPFMHSEILAEQERGVDLFKSLGNENATKYAIEHRDIIAKFGRFPHRNKALGRTSTPVEEEFLKDHSGFGQ